MNIMKYTVAYSLPISLFVALPLGGPWLLMPVLIAFGLLPVADPVFGHDQSDLEEGSSTWAYDLLVRAWVPTQILVFVAALLFIAAGDWSWAELVYLSLGTGVTASGGGINVAHELMHRRERLDRGLSEVLMTMVCYTHFCVEHVLGHHKNVSTSLDPASSRLGESVYAFLPRTIFGGLASAWRIESTRVSRRALPWWSLKDRRLRYALMQAGACAIAVTIGGIWGLVWFLLQSFIGVSLLEVVNYIEHYGLQREEVAPGRYERVQPHHSWNSTQRLTNWFLFNLPRHADHHAWANRPYMELRAWPDAPAMPWGYPTMMLLALVPPLWFRVMDPRVAAVRRKSEAA